MAIDLQSPVASETTPATNHTWFTRFDRLFTVALIVVPILIVLLFLYIGRYAHPQIDDFTFAALYRKYGLWGFAPYMYMNKGGAIVSTYLASMLLFKINIFTQYPLVPLFFIFAQAICFIIMLKTIGLRFARGGQFLLACLIFFALYLISSPIRSEAYYWLVGAACYTFAICVLSLFMAVLFLLMRAKSGIGRTGLVICLCLLAILTTGATITSMVGLDMLMLVCFLTLFILKQPKKMLTLLPVLLVCVVCSLIVVCAPGNANRAAIYIGKSHSMFISMPGSILQTLFLLFRWAFNPVLIATSILGWPLINQLSHRISGYFSGSERQKFRLVLLPIAWVVLLWATIFPNWWAQSFLAPERCLTVTYFLFLLGWFGCLVLVDAVWNNNSWLAVFTTSRAVLIVKILLVLALIGNQVFFALVWDSLRAAPRYHRALLARYHKIEMAKMTGQLDVVVDPLLSPPPTLYVDDLGAYPKLSNSNGSFAQLFGVRSVRVSDQVAENSSE